MSVEIKVPVLPESVTDATIATWHKQPGDAVNRDENLVDIETDKVVLEVVAPADGAIEKIVHEEGATVKAQEVIAFFGEGAGGGAASAGGGSASAGGGAASVGGGAASVGDGAASKDAESEKSNVVNINKNTDSSNNLEEGKNLSPAVRRMVSENQLDVNAIPGSGKDGRINKQDVEEFMAGGGASTAGGNTSTVSGNIGIASSGAREEKRVPMTRLRAKIAERLLQAQQNAAILTTFNEINMQPAMDLRNKYKEAFEKQHGVKLGFMSFFVMAVVQALKQFPAVNASIDEKDIVYHGYFDIGIAVSSPRGLVVPILRNADQLSMAEIEQQIRSFGQKAKNGTLTIDEMTGGTFTISNGGVFGSLMSTPILNPPQSGILGMHKIEQRPVVEDGQIIIRPMMYVALSYDHRIIDGAESVQFLVAIKNVLEEPARLLLSI